MSAVAYLRSRTAAGGRRDDVRPYVSAWVVGGIAAVVYVLTSGFAATDAATVAVMLAVTIVAELVEVRVTLDRTGSAFTLGESAIAAGLLVLPGGWALLTALVGLGTVLAARRRGLMKTAFNLGQVAVAMTAALLVSRLVSQDPGPGVDAGSLSGVGLGMAVYGLLNVAAMAGLVRRLWGRSFLESAWEHGDRLMASVLGNTAIGMLIAVLAATRPALLILLAAPAAAMHLSSRGSLRSLVLLAEVRTERDRLDRVVAGASDGIVLLDTAGDVELWSAAMAEITGIPAPAAIGRHHATLLTPGDQHLDRDDADDADGPWTVEGPILRADGTGREVHATCSRILGPDGVPDGTVVVVRDVTRQREVEAMKHDFVARVSHELRTPLAPIHGMASTLLRHRDRLDDERVESALRLIAERSQHMSRLVEDLLLVSRITSASASLANEVEPATFDIGEVVRRATEWVADEHPDRRFDVAGSSASAVADELRTRQILTNLLSNACKYSPAGSPVDVDLWASDGQVVVSVADRGPGIPDDKKELVFDRFQRLEDPMTMTTGGVGLGLFISRHLAEAMDGTLEVEDRPGGGSRFLLRLPGHGLQIVAAS